MMKRNRLEVGNLVVIVANQAQILGAASLSFQD